LRGRINDDFRFNRLGLGGGGHDSDIPANFCLLMSLTVIVVG
jgi:hypothetical protein